MGLRECERLYSARIRHQMRVVRSQTTLPVVQDVFMASVSLVDQPNIRATVWVARIGATWFHTPITNLQPAILHNKNHRTHISPSPHRYCTWYRSLVTSESNKSRGKRTSA